MFDLLRHATRTPVRHAPTPSRVARPGRRAPDRPWTARLHEPSAPIRRAQAFVRLCVGDIRTVEDLADAAGLSRAHFARRFHAETGEAPWAFVRRVRDAEARRRLGAGTAPAEVAHATGYADQAHLTRAMRARYGRTPGQIRAARALGPDGTDVQDAEAPEA